MLAALVSILLKVPLRTDCRREDAQLRFGEQQLQAISPEVRSLLRNSTSTQRTHSVTACVLGGHRGHEPHLCEVLQFDCELVGKSRRSDRRWIWDPKGSKAYVFDKVDAPWLHAAGSILCGFGNSNHPGEVYLLLEVRA